MKKRLERIAGAAVLLLGIVACAYLGWPVLGGADVHVPAAAYEGEGTPVLLAAGDISSCWWRADSRTAELLDTLPGVVAPLGDNVYLSGSAAQYRGCYAPTWGRHRERTRPAVGNHEYRTPGAAGYFGYFGGRAGEPGKGYYSYELGAWHVAVLNSEIAVDPGSAQLRWLEADLAANPSRCVLAYWHRPRFSSGRHGSNPRMGPLWDALYAAGADVVVVGHDHLYERFAPQTPEGQLDPEHGLRQFTVGTGGAPFYPVRKALAHSEVRNNHTHGLLRLSLHDDGYAWEFVPVHGSSFRDRGQAACHGAPRGPPGPAHRAAPEERR